MLFPTLFTPEPTADGSFTFYSGEFGEAFHNRRGAKQEAAITFVQPLDLTSRVQQGTMQLLDIGYGLGYNTAAALAVIWATNPRCRVTCLGLEVDPRVPQAAIAHGLLASWPAPIPQLLAQLATEHQVESPQFQAKLLVGDGRKMLRQLPPDFRADGIFLDAFSPPRCPVLWTVEFLQRLAQVLKPDGRLTTYSCAAAIRAGLLTAGLNLASTPGMGRLGTVAAWSSSGLPPLSTREQEHLLTRAAIPYRDPQLQDPPTVIQIRREAEQGKSLLEPTSRWKKRWLASYPPRQSESKASLEPLPLGEGCSLPPRNLSL